MRNYFWLDYQQLNDIYRYKTEEYSHTAVNRFNVMPDSIPDWVLTSCSPGGYFVGNVGPAHMDFRWFAPATASPYSRPWQLQISPWPLWTFLSTGGLSL
ncbi:hypothetical protein Bca52824_096299 [Brassica carinata]|uniref:Uncharacterized protein n=1 Tax=Brassica carinata TaxID=52824 RepID=A0A8X7THE4_BRACI|nr:hypothetical protein Bca52824_096299 [Brassica carinata]